MLQVPRWCHPCNLMKCLYELVQRHLEQTGEFRDAGWSLSVETGLEIIFDAIELDLHGLRPLAQSSLSGPWMFGRSCRVGYRTWWRHGAIFASSSGAVIQASAVSAPLGDRWHSVALHW